MILKNLLMLLFLFSFPHIASCKGQLIEFCGIDGAGKTTLSLELEKRITEKKNEGGYFKAKSWR